MDRSPESGGYVLEIIKRRHTIAVAMLLVAYRSCSHVY
jgi:hypothetical protein